MKLGIGEDVSDYIKNYDKYKNGENSDIDENYKDGGQ